MLNDTKLKNVAQLIRRDHDLTAKRALAGPCEIVAHGDLGPHNTVFKGDVPVGLIDWDDAAPGTRLRDFAYAVDCYTDLINKEISASGQARRVQLMCEAYGWQKPAMLLDNVLVDYRRALAKHEARKNKEAVEIFQELVFWLNVRIPEIIGTLRNAC